MNRDALERLAAALETAAPAAREGLDPDPDPEDIRAWQLRRGLSLAELRVLLAALDRAPYGAGQDVIADRLLLLVEEAVSTAEAFAAALRQQQ